MSASTPNQAWVVLRVIGPFQVLFPERLRSAPEPELLFPEPASVRGSVLIVRPPEISSAAVLVTVVPVPPSPKAAALVIANSPALTVIVPVNKLLLVSSKRL